MEGKKKILILFAHPAFHKSRINRLLLEEISNVEGVFLNNLYDSYPNFYIDIEREQKLLLEHDIIIWHHPFYWYSAPAILKEWIDLVLQHNFAYGKNGNALKGKQVFNAITSGGSREAYTDEGYNHVTINQLLLPFRKTAVLCKMEYLPPFVVHGTHLLDEKKAKVHAENYRKILMAMRDGIFTKKELLSRDYLNDILEYKEN